MSSVSSNLNPSVVKTALDGVFVQEWNTRNTHPQFVTAESSVVFNQDSVDRAAVITEIFAGTGKWSARSEEQDVPQSNFRVANQKTFSVNNFSQSLDISKNFFDDNMHGVYEKGIKEMASNGISTRDDQAFGLYRGAFTTTLTNSGTALIADAHTTIKGFTVDNKVSGALGASTLEDAIVALIEQKAQDGVIRGNQPTTLLVPPKLYKDAVEFTEATLRPGTGGTTDGVNEPNVFSLKYGINVATSQWLGAAAGGSDTAWFLLSANHSVSRWVRQAIQTDLVDYKFQRNNNYIYKGEYREALGAQDYVGLVGSTG
jgi:phage major head subunit gpT-like protein